MKYLMYGMSIIVLILLLIIEFHLVEWESLKFIVRVISAVIAFFGVYYVIKKIKDDIDDKFDWTK